MSHMRLSRRIINWSSNIKIILRHFDHLINILGEDKVAIGSDFDGAKVPLKIKNLVGMNVLKEFLNKILFPLQIPMRW